MTYARPVVVSALAGMSAIVSDGENGYVLKLASRDDLSRVLVRALKDESEHDPLTKRALEYIRQHHDWDHIGLSIAALYRELLML
jgi:glycosyltransferase involved in cell wall biosynthesis